MNNFNKFESVINATNVLKENNKSKSEGYKTTYLYYIAVTAVAPNDVTNQRYFTGRGISGDPRDAKTYDSEEAARADFKKVPKKADGNLIRNVRVLKKLGKISKESKKLKEAAEGTIEYYKNEYLPAMDNKKLVKHLETITLQNNGQYGKYDDMISAIEEEILSRMS